MPITLQHAIVCAERNLTHFHGVKGPSILFLLPSFNVVSDGLGPDYMHFSLLGATFVANINWFSLLYPTCLMD
jgi:hypothetical protein